MPESIPFSPVPIMRKLGLEPDPWQIEVLQGRHPRLLLNCCRQAGKSTTVALLALLEAIWNPHTTVLLLSRSHRQSRELFRIVVGFYRRLKCPARERLTREELVLTQGSRIVSLPCKEETIRGYSHIDLLIIDEAARVPDDLYRAVRPMLAVSQGRLFCLSTPYGRRGFFYDAWAHGGDDWHRIEVPASRIPRIPATLLEQERRALGESWFRQEYGCSFEAMEGLVYPDFARCVVPELPPHLQRPGGVNPLAGPAVSGAQWVGGLDFGLRNPFAAVWGVLDRDRVLWLTGEHYSRQRPLAYHADHLPRHVMWYADPAGAREIHELLHAGFKVRPGDNELRPGIAAVRARLEEGALKVLAGACPNLLAEAALYRYDPDAPGRSEVPLKEHDHALDALRYLVSRIDANRLARIRNSPPPAATDPNPPPPAKSPQQKWLSLYNEELWTRLD